MTTSTVVKNVIRIPASPTEIFVKRNQLNDQTISDAALKVFETYSWGGCACRNS